MGTQLLSGVATDEVVWYLSSRLTASEELAFAQSTDGVVLRGEAGADHGHRLRVAGYTGRLWLDPASYDRTGEDARRPAATLFGDRWIYRQDELGVAERISPGAYVGDRDH